jgi:3D domain
VDGAGYGIPAGLNTKALNLAASTTFIHRLRRFLKSYGCNLGYMSYLQFLLIGLFFIQSAVSAHPQTSDESKCSDGWYITGYYVPREDELPDVAEQIDVERAGSLSFSQKFLNEIRTEGWGITRFGWALGYYSGAWHRSDAGPLDASGKLLIEGAIAIDRSLIPHNAQVQITTLPSPWASRTFKATDIGNGIVGQHIDVFTGTGKAAEEETFRITSNNNRVCYTRN